MELFLRIFCLFSFLIPLKGQGPTSIQLISNTDSIALGEPFEVDVKITSTDVQKSYSFDFSSWKSIPNRNYPNDTVFLAPAAAVEILDGDDWTGTFPLLTLKSEDIARLGIPGGAVLSMKVTLFEPGLFQLPPPKWVEADSTKVNYSRPLTIYVSSPVQRMSPDSLQLADIRDIHREPAHWSDYTGWLIIILSIALVIAYWFWRRNRKTTHVQDLPQPVQVAPWDLALEKLQALRREKLWETGNIGAYQAALTGILRQYLAERYAISAMETTTDEIIQSLEKLGIPMEYLLDVREILQVADLVKFAKALPEENIHELFLNRTVAFVHKTKGVSA